MGRMPPENTKARAAVATFNPSALFFIRSGVSDLKNHPQPERNAR